MPVVVGGCCLIDDDTHNTIVMLFFFLEKDFICLIIFFNLSYSLEVIPCNLLSKLRKLQEQYTPFFHSRRRKCDADFVFDLRFLPLLSAFAATFVDFHLLPIVFGFGTLQIYYIKCMPQLLKDKYIRWPQKMSRTR